MQRFFENKFAFLAVFTLFAVPFVWNLSHGSAALFNSHGLMLPDTEMTAHGPSFPPPPDTDVRLAHGPSFPPPPDTDVRLAHGPSFPPPPDTDVRLAHGPSFPPPPDTDVNGVSGSSSLSA